MKTPARWLKGFAFAYEGVKYAFSTQRHMKFHVFASFLVLASALFFRISKVETLFVLAAITLVIVTELINTAIEKAVDLAMPERHPVAKIAKDAAAAAVLASAVFAVFVGIIVFYDPVRQWIGAAAQGALPAEPSALTMYIALVLLSVVVAETRVSRTFAGRPSLWMALVFSVATLTSLSAGRLDAAVAVYGAAFVLLALLYRRKNRTLSGLLFGAVLGAAMTALAYALHHS